MEESLAPVPATEASTAQPKYSHVIQRTREQKGHSLILHLTLGAVVLWIPAIYYTVSPNHYWHA